MKQLRNYINIKKSKSIIKATDETIKQIVKDELDRLGHDADLNHIDVSEVSKMNNLFDCSFNFFKNISDLNMNISLWDVSHVKTMFCMFYKCKNFNQDLSQWDVSNVKDMGGMFSKCENFNQDLSQWDVSNVENMNHMFFGCKNFNQNLSGWDVNNIKKGHYQNMFDDCPIKKEFKPKFK